MTTYSVPYTTQTFVPKVVCCEECPCFICFKNQEHGLLQCWIIFMLFKLPSKKTGRWLWQRGGCTISRYYPKTCMYILKKTMKTLSRYTVIQLRFKQVPSKDKSRTLLREESAQSPLCCRSKHTDRCSNSDEEAFTNLKLQQQSTY